MTSVAILIAAPDAALDRAVVAEAARVLRGTPDWLANDEAAEIPFDAIADAGKMALQELVAGLPVDLALVPAADRRKRLLVSDMDSTIITVECIDELADYAGLKEQVAATTRRAMNGEIDFQTALCERVALLAGLKETVVDEVMAERVRLMPGAAALVATMRAHGAFTALVSGGFTVFTRRVRQLAGFHVDEANRLEIARGVLTGKLIEPILDATSKLAAMRHFAEEYGVAPVLTLAVGDGANDLPMIEAAGLGVAFRAHERVRARAPVNIRHGDLTALLHLQGYRRDEFVTACGLR